MAFIRMFSLRKIPTIGMRQVSRTVPLPSGLLCRRMLGSSNQGEEFQAAQERVKSISKDPGNEAKLKLYALFKQATLGKCNTPKPGMMDFVGKAKWTAWTDLGNISKDAASDSYISFVEELVSKDAGDQPAQPDPPGDLDADIVYSVKNSYAEIRLNRPKKFNAITWSMYKEIGELLERASGDGAVKFAVLRGTGDYYSSGNDLGNFANIPPEGPEKMAKDGGMVLEKFVSSFIDFDKPLIAVVNGPAVGIPVTTLGLCDIVFAKETATFHTPFTSLGQSPEACSSYLFPKIMGTARANEVLLFGKKLNATEAYERCLITKIIPSESFDEEVDSILNNYATTPPISLRTSKQIIRESQKDKLHEINRRECALLMERWVSDECISAIMSFFQRKK